MIQIRNVLQKWYRGNTVSLLTSRKTKIAKQESQDYKGRKRTGDAVLPAENFGDLITADHKVLSEGCESRNNHRYAVVVQDFATPMDTIISV